MVVAATFFLLSAPGHWAEALSSFLQSWWPWPSTDDATAGFPLDKVVHAALFALCAALCLRGWGASRRLGLWLCVALLAFGGLTELIQFMVPGRSASLADWAADGVGVLVGACWSGLLRERPIVGAG